MALRRYSRYPNNVAHSRQTDRDKDLSREKCWGSEERPVEYWEANQEYNMGSWGGGEIWISELLAWAACGHTKTKVREVAVMKMMSRSYPSLKDIRQFLALSPRQGNSVGGWGWGRSKFDKIAMFCDCLECLIPADNERTLLIHPMQMRQKIQWGKKRLFLACCHTKHTLNYPDKTAKTERWGERSHCPTLTWSSHQQAAATTVMMAIKTTEMIVWRWWLYC